MEIATMNIQLLKTVGLAVLFGKLIAGCALDRRAETPEDAKITTDVRSLLDQHPDLGPPDSIRVSTANHVVYLSGSVNTELEGREAAEIAHRARGVARVVNDVAVEQ
jgi:osmotically-inducible protein OsmY